MKCKLIRKQHFQAACCQARLLMCHPLLQFVQCISRKLFASCCATVCWYNQSLITCFASPLLENIILRLLWICSEKIMGIKPMQSSTPKANCMLPSSNEAI